MHTNKPIKVVFIDEVAISEELRLMELDPGLKTISYYTEDPTYADNLMPFPDKHVQYLKGHPKVNPEHYLANLRTMIKIRY